MSALSTELIRIGRVAKTARQWAEMSGVSAQTIYRRHVRGCPSDKLLATGHAGLWQSKEAWEGANKLPYAEDVVAQVVVNGKGGMTLEEIGICLGTTRERVRQVEEKAIGKLLERLRHRGLDKALLAWLQERDGDGDGEPMDRRCFKRGRAA